MIVANRYAKSLLELAVEKGQLEKVYADMQLVQSVYQGNKDFVNFLNSPIIHLDKKQAVIKAVFGNNISDISLGFFKILTDKRRENYLGDIAKAFIEQYKEHKDITTAVVTSAAGIDGSAREKILKLVKDQVKGEVELVEKVDKDLIGGFVLRIGDKQVDASISRKLNELRKSFSENPHTININ
jgi:F-type H+-transporting ATPase subunit delta